MKVWIETRDRSFGRMLVLKLKNAGIEAVQKPEEAQIALVDLDTAGSSLPTAAITHAIGFTSGKDPTRVKNASAYLQILHRPFAFDELLALLAGPDPADANAPRVLLPQGDPPDGIGAVRLSENGQFLLIGEHSIPLSRHEAVVCRRLLESPGEPVSREELRGLFLSPEESDSNLPDVYVCHIRQKVETTCHIRLIRTVRGKGYQIG